MELARLEAQARISPLEINTLREANLLSKGTFLDVGCGPGYYAEQLINFFPNISIVGADYDPFVIEEAKKRMISVAHAYAHNLPFQKGQFDGVIARLLLRHISNPQDSLHEFVRVVRPGGSIIVIDIDHGLLITEPTPLLFSEAFSAHQRTVERRGANPFIGRKLYSMLKHAGLTNVRILPVSISTCEIGSNNFAQTVLSFITESIDPDLMDEKITKQARDNIQRWGQNDDSFGVLTGFIGYGYLPKQLEHDSICS